MLLGLDCWDRNQKVSNFLETQMLGAFCVSFGLSSLKDLVTSIFLSNLQSILVLKFLSNLKEIISEL